jgi:hypothetical protein
VTFVAAVITLLTAFNPFDAGAITVSWVVGILAALVACVNLMELIANFDEAARKHEDLYKRFKQLQARVAIEGEENAAAWESEAQTIRADEPPTMWAIYARCWNQTIDRHGAEREGYYREVGTLQSLIGYLWHYRPSDFPSVPVRGGLAA